MNDRQMLAALLEAAISHAKRTATSRQARRDVAMFWLRVEATEMKKNRRFWQYLKVCAMLHELQEADTLTSYLENLRNEPDEVTALPPLDNMGVSSPSGGSDPARNQATHDTLAAFIGAR